MKKCCVLFITHKPKLSGNEEKSLIRGVNVFTPKRDMFFVLPENMSTEYYDRFLPKVKYVKVNPSWLSSNASYNKMCCSKEFYDLFSEYEYMLIYQDDCWVYEDNLDYFINLDFDWYGAPWPHYHDKVGNGGFCMRRIKKMAEISEKYDSSYVTQGEDRWFCLEHGDDFTKCDLDNACNFSMELIKNEYLKKIKTCPMGLHDKRNIPLWGEPEVFINFKKELINKHIEKVAVCCIGRLENKYIREYVSYYEKIGFDKIFLYDNNMEDEERFEDVIGDYIENGFVEVIDYRGRDRAQLSAYQDCYDRHGDEYDWIGFFDIDEFFTFINREPNIKVYLSDGRFRDYDMIHVNWLCYGDNDLVRYEDKPVTKRFTHPIAPFDSKRTYDFPENNHIKTLIRGGLNNVKWSKTPHTPICDGIKCCNGAGEECNPNSPFNNYEYSTVCLRHYQTKTIEEFYTNKVKRGYPDGNKSFFDTHSWVTNFFKSNKITSEKLAYINEVSDNKNKLDIFICTHKDFEPPVKNPCYKIINAKDINNDTAENGLPGSFYSEFLIYFDVAKRKDLKDYIGFCHYRKYFSFMDNIPDMDDLFKECDIVTVDRITFRKNIKEQYAACHNVDDLEIVENIIREKFPEYADAADYTFNRCNKMFQCNMFIMKKNDFLDYIKFIKSVLDEYLNVVGMDINQRILDNKEKYLKNIKDKPQNSEIWYQYRIGGYLGERLTNVFIYGNRERFGKIKTYKLTETEEKYKKKDKEMKKLALIIPTKDNSESLLRLLYSIVYHTEYNKTNLALYIVDNGSKENEKNKVIEHINRVIKEYGYNIKFYETDNYTLPQLYNFVANEKVDADTDLLLFCTDNVELTNDCISNLVNNWSEQCGTLGARLMLEDNTIQHIGYNIKKDNFTCYDVVQKQVLPAEYRNTKINVYGNSNSFMLTSFALWKQLNGFDEKYKSNFFDIDYSIKALLNGKNSYNITGAICWYHKAIKSKYAKRDENRISKRIKEYLTILDEAAEKRREDKAKNA